MPGNPKPTTANIIVSMRYRDAEQAIEFLCEALGFEKKAVYPGAPGVIEHAELTFGNGMIMLGSVRDTPFGRYLKQPSDAGAVTQSTYLVVDDADAHYARAKAAGAEILREPVTQDYGGRDYTCRDPEGFIWTFGTYDPWAS